MTITRIQRSFSPFKTYLPKWAWQPIRALTTALCTPMLFSYQSGHFLSSLRMMAVAKNGAPLPWYSYPCIEFLKHRDYRDKVVLEFGGGQSTLWWAQRARRVVTLEGDQQWYES